MIYLAVWVLPHRAKTRSSTPSPAHLYSPSAKAKFSTSALKGLTISCCGPMGFIPAPESMAVELASRVSTAAALISLIGLLIVERGTYHCQRQG